MKRIVSFTVLVGCMVTLTVEGSSHKAGNLPGSLGVFINSGNFTDAAKLWDPHGGLQLSSQCQQFEGFADIASALAHRYKGWKLALELTSANTNAWPDQAPLLGRNDLAFINWVYVVQKGSEKRTELYSAIAQRRKVNAHDGPSDREHEQQWRFLMVKELPAPPPLH
jgi:hypothetical protein